MKMAKDYFVLRGGRVVYAPGHYDIADAETLAKAEIQRHPRAKVQVVRVEFTYQRPTRATAG